MKHVTLLSFFLFALAISHAAILRCNNNITAGVYANAQAAHDAAMAGDTIHLEPSGDYGALSITKKIVLISTGDFIQQHPGVQANPFVGWCTNITLLNGSEYSVIRAKVSQYISIQTHNITIANTHCPNINLGATGYAINNARIYQSIMEDGIYANYGWTDLLLENNYINNLISYNNHTSSYGTFKHNIFGANVTTLVSSTISNNIFLYGLSHNNCILSNNLSSLGYGAQLPIGNGNVNEVDMSTVFQHWGNFNGDNYQLLASCPYQYAGIYAGANPYRPACTPPIPSIYQLSIPNTLTGNTLPITVSTKSNN